MCCTGKLTSTLFFGLQKRRSTLAIMDFTSSRIYKIGPTVMIRSWGPFQDIIQEKKNLMVHSLVYDEVLGDIKFSHLENAIESLAFLKKNVMKMCMPNAQVSTQEREERIWLHPQNWDSNSEIRVKMALKWICRWTAHYEVKCASDLKKISIILTTYVKKSLLSPSTLQEFKVLEEELTQEASKLKQFAKKNHDEFLTNKFKWQVKEWNLEERKFLSASRILDIDEEKSQTLAEALKTIYTKCDQVLLQFAPKIFNLTKKIFEEELKQYPSFEWFRSTKDHQKLLFVLLVHCHFYHIVLMKANQELANMFKQTPYNYEEEEEIQFPEVWMMDDEEEVE